MIMEAIFRGKFRPIEDIIPQEPAYDAELEAADRMTEDLRTNLNSADFEKVKQILKHSAAAHLIENEAYFNLGVSTGIQLQKELLAHLQHLHL